jgi:hypothetical protein
MPIEIIKIVILAFLIVLSIFTLYYTKTRNKETGKAVFEGFDVNDPMPRDIDNKALTDDQLYGDIPQNASISIFKKAELKGATANPDAIPIADGDAHGNGGGPELNLTDIPAQDPPSDDIEAILTAAIDAPDVPDADDGMDGFTNMEEGFQSNGQGGAQQQAQQQAQSLAQNKLDKLKKKVMKRVKNAKITKMAGRAVEKAKTVALKGVKKVRQKIAGVFAKKVGAKLGAKASENIFKKVAKKLVTKISEAIGKSSLKAAALSSNPFTLAIGVMLTVITGIATAVGIALPIVLKGDEGVCEPGWKKISEVWPSFLDNIPGVGDIMNVIGSYLCFLDRCDGNEQEEAGLCYDKCDNGYNGGATTCAAKSSLSNPKAPAKTPCPPGMRDDGTSCWRDSLPNGVGTIPRLGGCDSGQRDDGTSCWDDIKCDPIRWNGCKSRFLGGCVGGAEGGGCRGSGRIVKTSFQRGSYCGFNQTNVAGLCYNNCAPGYHFAGGNLCEPDGGPGIKKTLMDRQYCPDPDRELVYALTKVDQQCYKKCPPDTPFRIPGMPYTCSAAKFVGVGRGGTTYDRGVGRPKLKLKMVTKTPPPPPPPDAWMSLAYADDPDNTSCKVDFSNVVVLQEMCDFYYQSSVVNANVNADGTVSFGYITKINKVIGSSEQSADVLCDITNVIVNMDTGKTVSSNLAAGSDRRFYFAKITKVCKFFVVGATNTNKTAPDVTSAQAGEAKDVAFTPLLQKCANIPIGLKKCQGRDTIDAMMAIYKKTLPPTVRIKSIDAVQDSGTSICMVAWKEVTYDALTNVESVPTVKAGKFTFKQDASTDACAYKLQGYAPADPTSSVKALTTPITYDMPVPAEVTLQGCATTCKDPIMLQKLVSAFNNSVTNKNRIISVSKVTTPGPLRCDVEASVFVSQTKQTATQRIRFDLTKDQASCSFSVAKVGEDGTGTFIQSNTMALGTSFNTKDFLVASDMDTVKSAQTNLAASTKKISDALGQANTAYENAFAKFGQVETLGTCPKKCSDPDVLTAIISYFNNANYPSTRTNVTKKTMGRILKAGTSGTNTCDILFEEKQETYSDLYASAPTTNVTQKTQRFTMKDAGNCQFSVDTSTTLREGFAGIPMTSAPVTGRPVTGRPGKEGFQASQAVPSVINNATPSLTPPYTGTGCQLDCTNATVLAAMKTKYQSANIEGFQSPARGPKGFFGRFFSGFTEAFQDVADGTEADGSAADGSAADGSADVGSGDYVDDGTMNDSGVTDWNATAPETGTTVAPATPAIPPTPNPVKVVNTTNMKKVNRALKLGTNKCEYEVVYDATNTDSNGNTTQAKDQTGYFTTTFSQDTTGCSFTPSQVVKSTTPIIPTVPTTNTANIAFSF